MLIAEFMEVSYKARSKMSSYHAVAAFPKDTVRHDIHKVILYVIYHPK